jgi:Ca2+-binding EF-hand superfamily protein
MPTLTTVTKNVPDYRKMSPHFDGMFNDLSQGLKVDGANVVSKEQYLSYFGLSNAQAGTQRGQNVLRKFQTHDRNGDGYLTPDEMSLLCDENGCDEA